MPLFVISSPGEEKAQLGSYQDKITGAQTGIQKISSKYKEKASVTEGCLNTARGCSGGVSMLGDVQNPTQWGHRQLAVADLHWAQGLDQTISRAHRESTILWFCLQSLLHCMSCRDVSHRLHKFFFFFLTCLYYIFFMHCFDFVVICPRKHFSLPLCALQNILKKCLWPQWSGWDSLTLPTHLQLKLFPLAPTIANPSELLVAQTVVPGRFCDFCSFFLRKASFWCSFEYSCPCAHEPALQSLVFWLKKLCRVKFYGNKSLWPLYHAGPQEDSSGRQNCTDSALAEWSPEVCGRHFTLFFMCGSIWNKQRMH